MRPAFFFALSKPCVSIPRINIHTHHKAHQEPQPRRIKLLVFFLIPDGNVCYCAEYRCPLIP